MKLKSFLFRSTGKLWSLNVNNEKIINNPIFIVGCHRSGTTLLSRILSKSKEVVNWSEANYIWEPHYYHPLTLKKSFIPDFNGEGKGIHGHEISKFDRDYIEDRVKNYFNFYSFLHGSKRIVQQNPYNTLRLEEIIDWFPDCKIVAVTRDVRAVVNSHFNRYRPHYDFGPEAVMYKWKLFRDKVKQVQDKYPDKVAEISYRSMSGEGSDELFESLFRFCDLKIMKKPWKEIEIENRNYKYKKELDNSVISYLEKSVDTLAPEPLGTPKYDS